MDHFRYKDGELYAEGVAVTDIIDQHGSPCYIYSKATFERHWHAFNDAFNSYPHLVCYAVKANSNIAILNLLAQLGSGFDIVSAGELERVLFAGAEASKVVFSGIGKTAAEMQRALSVGIHCFNVESEAELERLQTVAKSMDLVAPVSLRVNPDVDAQTHPYISTVLKENKFCVDIDSARRIYQKAHAMSHIAIKGIDCHIGSQLTEITPFLDALDRVLSLLDTLKEDGITVEHVDIGGGLGICYDEEQPPAPAEYAKAIMAKLEPTGYSVIMEPGRAIAGNAGIFVTQVEYLKTSPDKNFIVVDGAMNDLIRPALYQAWQEIVPVKPREGDTIVADVVGPICETGDFLGKDRALNVEQGDLLAVRSSGAYGFTMSSNYNTRPRVAEIMVDGSNASVIRKRETIDELFANESMLP